MLRAVLESIDFSFIYDEVKDLYSETHGRPSVDPVVLIKLLILQALFGIRSMRQTIEEVKVKVAYRWFLGYGLQEQIPHFSTFGKNYVRRFQESDLLKRFSDAFSRKPSSAGFSTPVPFLLMPPMSKPVPTRISTSKDGQAPCT